MTSKRKRKPSTTKRNKPDSPSSPATPSSSGVGSSGEEETSSSAKLKQSKNFNTATSDQKLIIEKFKCDNRKSIPFITPQHIKKEMGMMKLNGHVNDLDECFSENSILFGKEINSSRKRSIVMIVKQQDENFKQSQLKQSNNNLTSVLIGSKKRKQTRPIQAPVPSFQ